MPVLVFLSLQVPIGDRVMAQDLAQRLQAIENLVITLKQDVCTLQRSLTEIKGVLEECCKKCEETTARSGEEG